MLRKHVHAHTYEPCLCIAGVVARYGVLFPLRVLLLLLATSCFFMAYAATLALSAKTQKVYQQRALQMFAFCWGMRLWHCNPL